MQHNKLHKTLPPPTRDPTKQSKQPPKRQEQKRNTSTEAYLNQRSRVLLEGKELPLQVENQVKPQGHTGTRMADCRTKAGTRNADHMTRERGKHCLTAGT